MSLAPDGTCWVGGVQGATHVGTDGTVLGTVSASYAMPGAGQRDLLGRGVGG